MRAYLIQDLYSESVDKIEEHLKSKGYMGSIEGIYYLPVPKNILTDEQAEHHDECGPYILGLEVIRTVEGGELRMELLVRAQNKLRCSCVAYAAPAQREHMIEFLDGLIRELDISV